MFTITWSLIIISVLFKHLQIRRFYWLLIIPRNNSEKNIIKKITKNTRTFDESTKYFFGTSRCWPPTALRYKTLCVGINKESTYNLSFASPSNYNLWHCGSALCDSLNFLLASDLLQFLFFFLLRGNACGMIRNGNPQLRLNYTISLFHHALGMKKREAYIYRHA